jgi:cyclomaltodextrinase / maltogenic alpha-amylase / neopullulanase
MTTLPNIIKRCLALALFAALSLNPSSTVAADAVPKTARTSPSWLRNAVVYEVFPRNFSSEGTFNAITARLDELKDLGADVLWLMPIHPIGEKMKKGAIGSPYAVRDYFAVNPDYGTADDFKKLVAAAHQRGMKVVMDIVAGHTSWDNVLISQHPEFYKKDAAGKIIPPNPDWSDVAGLNYENPELRRYMVGMLKHWMKEFGVDGFRCDVAFTVPIAFWETAHAELESVNPEVILLADANAAPMLLARAFDMDNSGALHNALNRVMSGISPAYLIAKSWENTKAQFPEGALHLRFSDNHENARAVARHGIQGALAAQVLMLTLDGVPLFYNGMEVGDATESADPALFEKLPVFWNPAGRPPLRDIYRSLIKLRRDHSAFRNDTVIWQQNSASAQVVSFSRKDGKSEFLILVNLSSHTVSGTVELTDAEQFNQLKLDGLSPQPRSALPEFKLGGYEWRIYQREAAKQ